MLGYSIVHKRNFVARGRGVRNAKGGSMHIADVERLTSYLKYIPMCGRVGGSVKEMKQKWLKSVNVGLGFA